MKIKIVEIFYSLQGEGARTGIPSIFIRLSNCNLLCSFCDTDWTIGEMKSLDEIIDLVKTFPCKNIIWTGGEPTLQLTKEVVDIFKEMGYFQSIETNGTNRVPKGIDYITCSPKVSEFVLKSNFPDGVDEFRFPIEKNSKIPKIENLPPAKNYFLSPIFDYMDMNPNTMEHAINYILAHPEWRLSIQQHKIWKVR